MRRFDVNSIFLFIIAIALVGFIIAQSIFFLIRAYRRGKTIGMDKNKLRKTIVSSALFTVVPAISVFIGVITLSKFLGIPLPWIRMSVIGAVTYELPAATSAANALGISLSETVTNPHDYSTIAWVMTLGILPSLVFTPILIKPMQKGLRTIKDRDEKWSDILLTAMFLGMISAFLGMVFADIGSGIKGYIPVFVLLFSAAVMGLFGIMIKKFNFKRMEVYALPVSMVSAMVFACVISEILK